MAFLKKKLGKKKINITRDLGKDIRIKFIRKVLPFVIISGVFFTLIFGAKIFFLKLSYFKVGEITITGGDMFARKSTLANSEMIKILKDESIFVIDIEDLANSIQKDYPELKNVKVSKIMPNSLEIKVYPRVPVALMKSFTYYPVDETGVVLSPENKFYTKLPVIQGVPMWTRPKIGQKLESDRLNKALLLLENLGNIDILPEYEIQRIEVSNLRNVLLFLKNGLEVRLGSESFLQKLEQLQTILKDPKIDKNNLKYIDLRFKDVVLAPR